MSSVVHSNNKTEVTNLAQITGLQFERAKLNFIPYGIGNNFSNLKLLIISSCGLLNVNKDNMKDIGNSLELLSLTDNKLIFIDADLLEYNSNLRIIWLYDNRIRHIDPEFFLNLNKLKSLNVVDMKPAGCMKQSFYTSKGHDIATFKWNNDNCTDPAAKLKMKCLINNLK